MQLHKCQCGESFAIKRPDGTLRSHCPLCRQSVDLPQHDLADQVLERNPVAKSDLAGGHEMDAIHERNPDEAETTQCTECGTTILAETARNHDGRCRVCQRRAQEPKKLYEQVQIEAHEKWMLQTFGRRGTAILSIGGLLLLPVAIFLAEYYLEDPGALGRNQLMSRIAVYGAIWGFLALVFLGPIAFVIKVPAMLRFIAGETEYRVRWLQTQAVAWISTVTCYVGGIIYWYARSADIGLSLMLPLLGGALAGFAFYFGAMGTMPHNFFAMDRVGRMIHRFVACETTKGVPIRCILASVILLLIAIGMGVLPAIVITDTS